MTPYTALETLMAYAPVVFALLGGAVFGWLMYTPLSGLVHWLLSRVTASPRTTAKERQEKLLRLISSTERKTYR